MVKKKRASSLDVRQAMDFLNQLLADKPILPFVIPLFLVVWGIEKWIFSLTNWVPLTVAVWAVFQVNTSLLFDFTWLVQFGMWISSTILIFNKFLDLYGTKYYIFLVTYCLIFCVYFSSDVICGFVLWYLHRQPNFYFWVISRSMCRRSLFPCCSEIFSKYLLLKSGSWDKVATIWPAGHVIEP